MGQIPDAQYPETEISEPKQEGHGDFACNFAMVASKIAGQNPREFGQAIADRLMSDPDFEKVEVAGPGFINMTVRPGKVSSFLQPILAEGLKFCRVSSDKPLKINVEFVSVNPNGPITIGSGRGAAYGSTLCNILEAAGHTIHREYYINDGVNSEQMRLFAESVKAIVEGRPVPDNGYKGDYVHATAANLAAEAAGKDVAWFQSASESRMIDAQRSDLERFGVTFDTWFSEQSLHTSGEVARKVESLVEHGAADDEPTRIKLKMGRGGVIEDVCREPQADEAEDESDSPHTPAVEIGSDAGKTLWLRSTKFGDDMDRVLRRRDGRLTYISSDIAYHNDKFNRPPQADKLITVLGPDHHGYISRLQAVLAAVELSKMTVSADDGAEPLSDIEAQIYRSAAERDACRAALAKAKSELEVLIFQLVRFMKDGKPAPMRKRDGNIYALIDLINEIGEKVKRNGTAEEKQTAGKDVARFFYLMRNHDTTFDFDLNLAERQSDENPVFYVQYAHARICSVIDKAAEAGLTGADPNLALLTDAKEKALIIKLCDLPNEVKRSAHDYAVNRLTTYAIELARTYHSFYDHCRVIQPEQEELSNARVALCRATRIGLRATFDLLGISAPERMERSQAESHSDEDSHDR